MKYLRSFFKSKIQSEHKTSLEFSEYKQLVERNASFYCTEPADSQLNVEWKIGRGLFLVAVCTFEDGNPENVIKIVVKSKYRVFIHRYFLILWGILAGFWLVAEPGASSIVPVVFGNLILLSFWDFMLVNRKKLLDFLTPSVQQTDNQEAPRP